MLLIILVNQAFSFYVNPPIHFNFTIYFRHPPPTGNSLISAAASQRTASSTPQPASAGSCLAVLIIPLASCRPAAPTGQICQHPEHGSQDDQRSCRDVSQALEDPDISEGRPHTTAPTRRQPPDQPKAGPAELCQDLEHDSKDDRTNFRLECQP